MCGLPWTSSRCACQAFGRELDPHQPPPECVTREGLSRPHRRPRGRDVEGADRHDQPRACVRCPRGWLVPDLSHLRRADRDREDDGAHRHVPWPLRQAHRERAGRRSGRVRDDRSRAARRDDDHDHAHRRSRPSFKRRPWADKQPGRWLAANCAHSWKESRGRLRFEPSASQACPPGQASARSLWIRRPAFRAHRGCGVSPRLRP